VKLWRLIASTTLLAVVTIPIACTEAGASVPVMSFSGSANNLKVASGQSFTPATSISAGHLSKGYGSLSIFQEASPGSLAVSVGSAPAIDLGSGDFRFGLVPAGTYAVSANSGGAPVATGVVTVESGQYVTALVYRAVGGSATITGFVNDTSPPPVGQSRIVLRNTANVGPLDFYLNGSKVASSLANSPTSPQSASIVVPAGAVTVSATLAGQPVNNYLYSEQGVLLAGNLLNVFVVGDSTSSPSSIGFLTNANPLGIGYRLYAADGGTFNFGNADFYGSLGSVHLNKPIVGATPTSLGRGYWMVASDGGIFSFGDAAFVGSAGSMRLNAPVVGMAPTHDGEGYWLVASDGGIFAYGDATFHGSMGGKKLNSPIVGLASTPDGGGYWLVASDGGIFSFGDAAFYGSTGALALNKPIVAIVPTVDGDGYWLVASDGGVFSFGDAAFYGSTGGKTLNKPIVSAFSTADSLGYWLVASDGGVFSFGDAQFYGSTGSIKLNQPIVAGSPPGALLPS
jgi:hypothetical protein